MSVWRAISAFFAALRGCATPGCEFPRYHRSVCKRQTRKDLLAEADYWKSAVKSVQPSEDQGHCIFCMGFYGINHDWDHEPDCAWKLAQE